jgi:ribosomal protein L31
MKKFTHPKKQETILINSNGSTYKKTWTTFKPFIKLDMDINRHSLWMKKKVFKKKQ